MMKQFGLFVFSLIVLNLPVGAQEKAETYEQHEGITEKVLDFEGTGLNIGGYGQIDYNQPLNGDVHYNGKLDVHRLILFTGYRFNDRTSFVTEIEFEHVKEVYIEQAYLDYRLLPNMHVRAGLVLVPMGIINEYHEPTTYNGVERPNLDKYIVPTTWREIGVGVTGYLPTMQLKYQVYLLNGFNGYDGDANLNGKKGLRGGRQKGAESYISSPNLSAKFNYTGFSGLSLGLSGYLGDTQSTLYDGLSKNDETAEEMADSSVVQLAMVGLDYRYQSGGFHTRGQWIYGSLGNTEAYNTFTGSDLGSALMGYYLEAGYNVLHHATSTNLELIPFVRYEKYDTHQRVEASLTENTAYNRQEITAGLTLKVARGAAFKIDYQWLGNEALDTPDRMLNMGVGVWF
ncbi:MAG: hypothetical protein R6U66_09080 [Bacteroidales bacterium]